MRWTKNYSRTRTLNPPFVTIRRSLFRREGKSRQYSLIPRNFTWKIFYFIIFWYLTDRSDYTTVIIRSEVTSGFPSKKVLLYFVIPYFLCEYEKQSRLQIDSCWKLSKFDVRFVKSRTTRDSKKKRWNGDYLRTTTDVSSRTTCRSPSRREGEDG